MMPSLPRGGAIFVVCGFASLIFSLEDLATIELSTILKEISAGTQKAGRDEEIQVAF